MVESSTHTHSPQFSPDHYHHPLEKEKDVKNRCDCRMQVTAQGGRGQWRGDGGRVGGRHKETCPQWVSAN